MVKFENLRQKIMYATTEAPPLLAAKNGKLVYTDYIFQTEGKGSPIRQSPLHFTFFSQSNGRTAPNLKPLLGVFNYLFSHTRHTPSFFTFRLFWNLPSLMLISLTLSQVSK